jgi:NhaP-type Na+/H+ or K+/H+ antiporter
VSSAGIWLALLVGAALAPTDAALGAGMMTNPAVPARIRRLINVESGLNDGIAKPVVLLALAGAATGGEIAGHGPAAAVAQLALGIVVGVAVGGAGGLLVKATRRAPAPRSRCPNAARSWWPSGCPPASPSRSLSR